MIICVWGGEGIVWRIDEEGCVFYFFQVISASLFFNFAVEIDRLS
jgi:hypothetical protein